MQFHEYRMHSVLFGCTAEFICFISVPCFFIFCNNVFNLLIDNNTVL